MLLYSMISRATFETLPAFIKQISTILKAQNRRPPVVIVASKSEQEAQRVVSREEGELLAKEIGAKYLYYMLNAFFLLPQ